MPGKYEGDLHNHTLFLEEAIKGLTEALATKQAELDEQRRQLNDMQAETPEALEVSINELATQVEEIRKKLEEYKTAKTSREKLPAEFRNFN